MRFLYYNKKHPSVYLISYYCYYSNIHLYFFKGSKILLLLFLKHVYYPNHTNNTAVLRYLDINVSFLKITCYIKMSRNNPDQRLYLFSI